MEQRNAVCGDDGDRVSLVVQLVDFVTKTWEERGGLVTGIGWAETKCGDEED